MNIRAEMTERTAQIETILKAYLPKEEAYQKKRTVLSAAGRR